MRTILLCAFLLAPALAAPLTSYGGRVDGWTYGPQKLGVQGEGTDLLIGGNIDKSGLFTLTFSNDVAMLSEYLLPTASRVPYGDMCFYDVCDVNVSDEDASWLRVGILGDPALEEAAITNGEAVRADLAVERYKQVVTRSFVYADAPVDITGKAVSKEFALTVVYDLHLPRGWSIIEERGDFQFDRAGTLVGSVRTWRSLPELKTPWRLSR